MELTPTQLANLQAITISNNSKASTDELSVGQQILAKVIASDVSGNVTLNINNVILNAKSAIALQQGQLLQLLVSQTGKQVVLQLPQNVLQDTLTQQLLRESLPNQKPLNQTIGFLQEVLGQAKKLNLPPKITQSLQDFINRLPTPQQLSDGKSLQQVIRNSGIFLEKNLSQLVSSQNQFSGNDIKALLTQLKNVLSNERSTIAQQPQSQSNQTPKIATPLETSFLQIQVQKKDLAKDITTRVMLTQSESESEIQTQPQTSKTVNTTQTTTPRQQTAATTEASTEQIETALNIKTTQAGMQTLAKAAAPSSIPLPPQEPLVEQKPVTPNLSVPNGQYSSHKQATSVKEALDSNFIAPTHSADSTESSAMVSRFKNLIDLIDQLVKHVDSSLARTHLHQLHTLQEQDAGRMAWSLEIPVRQDNETHLVKLDIERDNQPQESEAAVTVNLAVNLESLGPVYSHITLVGNNINVVFWAEQEHTYNLAADSMDELQTSLEKSGFNTPKLNCHQGRPPQIRGSSNSLPDNLLDIKV